MIIYIKGLIFWWATGAMVFPFILVSRKSRNIEKTIRHEKIHFRQCLELWVIGFYLLYFYYSLKYKYRDIPFEKEAYDNAHKLHYLSVRKRHAWRNYLSV